MCQDWSLVLFTTGMQSSVGMIILYHIFVFYPLFINKAPFPVKMPRIISGIFILSLAAMGGAFFHPGQSLHGFNLSHTWLGYELLFGLMYIGLLLVLLLISITTTSYKRFLRLFLNLTAIAGLILIFTMVRVYYLPAQPAWYNFYTPTSFYLSAFILGGSWLLILQVNSGSLATQKALASLLILLFSVSLILVPIQMSLLNNLQPPDNHSLEIILKQNRWLFFIKLVTLIIALGSAILAYRAIRSDTTHCRRIQVPVWFLGICSVLAMLTDRILFYQLAS
ncbi:MAG: dimethyl sulfoxide reductase anchor subunit [Bacteroidales bacterium]|nr:dimethyl sulfoxide reductase anchor subunit [Bacteroidales bacterium]